MKLGFTLQEKRERTIAADAARKYRLYWSIEKDQLGRLAYAGRLHKDGLEIVMLQRGRHSGLWRYWIAGSGIDGNEVSARTVGHAKIKIEGMLYGESL